jgi:hypothetical protein
MLNLGFNFWGRMTLASSATGAISRLSKSGINSKKKD